jgi:hypothetical protein
MLPAELDALSDALAALLLLSPVLITSVVASPLPLVFVFYYCSSSELF